MFPIYRKMVAAAGVRGSFVTEQYFCFISQCQSLNVRLDNVFSIGYADDMPQDVAVGMVENWSACSEAEFYAAFNKARSKILLKWEMVP